MKYLYNDTLGRDFVRARRAGTSRRFIEVHVWKGRNAPSGPPTQSWAMDRGRGLAYCIAQAAGSTKGGGR